MMNPATSDRSPASSSSTDPKRLANTPPLSMSATITTGISAARASPRFGRSPSRRLISARLPAPSHTTTSKRARRSSKASRTMPARRGRRFMYSSASDSPTARPITMTCARWSSTGLSNTGFIADSGATLAAAACAAWARAISPPSSVTKELRDMFCALNGATLTPRRTSHRHRPCTTTLFPTSDPVPATRIPPLILATRARATRPTRTTVGRSTRRAAVWPRARRR